MMNDSSIPSWDLTSAYGSISSSEFQTDVCLIEKEVAKISLFNTRLPEMNFHSKLDVDDFVSGMSVVENSINRMANLLNFVTALTSVDGGDLEANAMYSKLSDLNSRLSQVIVPVRNFLIRADQSIFDILLLRPELASYHFSWAQDRLTRQYILNDQEEQLIEGLYKDGHLAWMDLYYRLIADAKCEIMIDGDLKLMGLADTAALLYGKSEEIRKNAFEAVQKSWKANQTSAAAIINALAGWRIELLNKRSQKQSMNILTEPLHENRISEETLNALLGCCRKNLQQIRRAPRAMAKFAGKSKLDPWDLTASCPLQSAKTYTYTESVSIIEKSFGMVSSEMADLVRLMREKSWVDAKPSPTRSAGGYCFEFAQNREPRVFLTFKGSSRDMITLAHELGHAYHYWAMRDIPLVEAKYPSTLAETASVYGETAFRDYLQSHAKTFEEKAEAGWSEMEGITGYLIDIPSRFEFEKRFHEKRSERSLNADELSSLMDESLTEWFGDTVSSNNKMFWATKLHFSSPGRGFYNFPYAFGYLFALSLYVRRKELGESFNRTYVAILRDTGRMTAEDLTLKHLGEDIRKEEFWQKAFDIVIQKIADFEKLIQ